MPEARSELKTYTILETTSHLWAAWHSWLVQSNIYKKCVFARRLKKCFPAFKFSSAGFSFNWCTLMGFLPSDLAFLFSFIRKRCLLMFDCLNYYHCTALGDSMLRIRNNDNNSHDFIYSHHSVQWKFFVVAIALLQLRQSSWMWNPLSANANVWMPYFITCVYGGGGGGGGRGRRLVFIEVSRHLNANYDRNGSWKQNYIENAYCLTNLWINEICKTFFFFSEKHSCF